MPSIVSAWDVIQSGTVQEPLELRQSGAAGAGPRSTHPVPTGVTGGTLLSPALHRVLRLLSAPGSGSEH